MRVVGLTRANCVTLVKGHSHNPVTIITAVMRDPAQRVPKPGPLRL